MKIPAVLAVISAFVSTASGAAAPAAPAIVTPTSVIPQTTSWTSAETQLAYSDISNLDDNFETFAQIFTQNRNETIKKWSKTLALGSEAYDGAQWMNYYLLIEKLKTGQFDFAIKIIDVLNAPGTSTATISKELRDLMLGGPKFDYEGILTRLADAERFRTPQNGALILDLQSKLTKFAYNIDHRQYANSSASDLLLPTALTAADNIIKCFAGILKSTRSELRANINKIVAYDKIELANAALSKLTTGEGSEVGKALADGGIWSHVKSEMMAKLLMKKFKITIFKSSLESVRSGVYALTNELARYKVLEMLKYDAAGGADNATILKIFEKDTKIFMRGALMAGKQDLVQAFFNNPITPVSCASLGAKWIIFAIKFSSHACLRVLLEERTPLPTEAELTKAYTLQKHEGSEAIVNSYKAKYTALAAARALPQAAPTTLHDPTISDILAPGQIVVPNSIAVQSFPDVERMGMYERGIFPGLQAITPISTSS